MLSSDRYIPYYSRGTLVKRHDRREVVVGGLQVVLQRKSIL